MGFSRQEYWSGLPCLLPGDLSDPGIEPGSPALQADSLPLNHQESPDKPLSLAKGFALFHKAACAGLGSELEGWCHWTGVAPWPRPQ